MSRATAPLEAELKNIYNWLDGQLAEVSSSCSACGACCKFEEFGHELWLTDVELAYLEPDGASPLADGCPFLTNGQCTARERRAIGCRTFFCEADRGRLEALHEEALRRLRAAAAAFGHELEYDELRVSLRRRDSAGR